MDTGAETAESIAEERAHERREVELVVARLIEALAWCSGGASSDEPGALREGWARICEPAIQQAYRWIGKGAGNGQV